MKCYNHADVEAVDRCSVCGRMVCRECRLDFDGKAVCTACVKPLMKVYASFMSGSLGGLDPDVKEIGLSRKKE